MTILLLSLSFLDPTFAAGNCKAIATEDMASISYNVPGSSIITSFSRDLKNKLDVKVDLSLPRDRGTGRYVRSSPQRKAVVTVDVVEDPLAENGSPGASLFRPIKMNCQIINQTEAPPYTYQRQTRFGPSQRTILPLSEIKLECQSPHGSIFRIESEVAAKAQNQGLTAGCRAKTKIKGIDQTAIMNKLERYSLLRCIGALQREVPPRGLRKPALKECRAWTSVIADWRDRPESLFEEDYVKNKLKERRQNKYKNSKAWGNG